MQRFSFWSGFDFWVPMIWLCSSAYFALSFLQAKKDSKEPFLLSGCKVDDGQGIMLVSTLSLWLLFDS
jgi:hypothetical protein